MRYEYLPGFKQWRFNHDLDLSNVERFLDTEMRDKIAIEDVIQGIRSVENGAVDRWEYGNAYIAVFSAEHVEAFYVSAENSVDKMGLQAFKDLLKEWASVVLDERTGSA